MQRGSDIPTFNGHRHDGPELGYLLSILGRYNSVFEFRRSASREVGHRIGATPYGWFEAKTRKMRSFPTIGFLSRTRYIERGNRNRSCENGYDYMMADAEVCERCKFFHWIGELL